jgi:hypothetical protein
MSVGSIGAGAAFAFRVATVGSVPDPDTQRAQVNAQADLLSALRGVNRGSVAAARVTDGAGVDIYM